MADINCCFIYSTYRFQQRGLVVEGLAGVGDKYGGDAQGVVYYEYGGGGVPCTVATCLEGIADTAIRETGSIGFLLYK